MPMMMNQCSSKRRKTSSCDHDDAFNGHEDLIWEILLGLPPKQVLRFKCVSKTWYSIISNLKFLRNHSLQFHRHSLQPPNEFLILPQDDEKEDLVLKHLDHDSPPPDGQPFAAFSVLPITGVLPFVKGSDLVLVDSCNGLVLYADVRNKEGGPGFRCMSRFISIDDDDDPHYLCNPVTKNYIKLPSIKLAPLFKKADNKLLRFKNLETRILFDPSVSLSYKVLRFVCRLENGGQRDCDLLYQIYVYSSESGLWRLSRNIVPNFTFSFACVYLNGVMHWMIHGSDLLCFDAEKDSVWLQPLPLKPKPNVKRRPFYFGECGGRLCLIEKYYPPRTSMEQQSCLTNGFDIMELSEDKKWTKKYHVNVVANHHHLIAAKIRILHIYKTGNRFKEEEEEEEEEEEAVLMKIDGRIVSFSLESNTFFGKELTIPNSRRPLGFVDVHPASISLFPL